VSLTRARLAADAVLYEGYLLYPYRSTAAKNQVRWQFGVLGPPGAAAAGLGEEAGLTVTCLLRTAADRASVTVHLRFLQLQRRTDAGTSWDEAVEVERELGTWSVAELRPGVTRPVRSGWRRTPWPTPRIGSSSPSRPGCTRWALAPLPSSLKVPVKRCEKGAPSRRKRSSPLPIDI